MKYKLDPTNNHAPDESAYLHLIKIQREIKESDVRGFDVYHRELTGLYTELATLQAENEALKRKIATERLENRALRDALGQLVSIVDIHTKATGNNFAWAELIDARALLAKEPKA